MRILGLILLGLLRVQQTTRQTASIRGIVVQSGTLQPVAKAVVQVVKDTSSEPLVFVTGADGSFEFQNVPAGTYDLASARNGYLTTAYGQRGPSGSGGK